MRNMRLHLFIFGHAILQSIHRHNLLQEKLLDAALDVHALNLLHEYLNQEDKLRSEKEIMMRDEHGVGVVPVVVRNPRQIIKM